MPTSFRLVRPQTTPFWESVFELWKTSTRRKRYICTTRLLDLTFSIPISFLAMSFNSLWSFIGLEMTTTSCWRRLKINILSVEDQYLNGQALLYMLPDNQ
ncbi:hypothetical protein JHK86_027352 [Glycine max]|nr:hypothetical protein JHK86_027352 [Glycine max]